MIKPSSHIGHIVKKLWLQRLLAVIILVYAFPSFAQKGVGIGTTDPDVSAVLDIVAAGTPRGILIPRLTTNDRLNITSPAEGLMVYDLTLQKFCVYQSGWYILDAMTRPASGTSITHTGDITLTGAMTISGTVTASNYALNAVGNGPIPQGGIIMWSGSIASIPTGWSLCDGSNSTPDLRERFIVGAGSSDNTSVTGTTAYSPSTVGGANSVSLTSSQLPAHSHTVSDPGHNHDIFGQWGGDNNDNNNQQRFAGGDKGTTETGFFFTNTFACQNTTTGITIPTSGGSGTSSGAAHENRPPYYALAFIMKL